jgi:hypothetical protein
MPPDDLRRLVTSEALRSGIRDAFRKHDAAVFPDVRIDYVRYKPDTSCVLGLRATDGTDVPLGYVKVFLNGDPDACLRKYRRRAKDDAWAESLPDLPAVLFRFPLDRNVRGLPVVTNLAKLKHLLHEVVPELSADGDRVRARKSRVSVLRYKPERRCIVRADVRTKGRDGSVGEKRIIAQAYGDETGGRVYRVMKRLRMPDALRSGNLRTPRPVGYHRDRRILLQEWADGVPWGETLQGSLAFRGSQAAARCLHALHALEPEDLPPLPSPVEAAGEAGRVLLDLARVGPARLARTAVALGGDLRHASGEVTPREPAVVHGDFHYGQLLLGAAGATLIDWDEAGAGDPRLDVGNLLAHLHLVELDGRVSSADAARLRLGFLETCLADRRPHEDLGFFVALHLAKLAMVPFRNLSPDWSGASLAIVERAREILVRNVEVAA